MPAPCRELWSRVVEAHPHIRLPIPRSVDPFSKKDWYDIRGPTMFQQRAVGKTLVTRTAGTKVRPRDCVQQGGRTSAMY